MEEYSLVALSTVRRLFVLIVTGFKGPCDNRALWEMEIQLFNSQCYSAMLFEEM
jgi:hypothetical protein